MVIIFFVFYIPLFLCAFETLSYLVYDILEVLFIYWYIGIDIGVGIIMYYYIRLLAEVVFARR